MKNPGKNSKVLNLLSGTTLLDRLLFVVLITASAAAFLFVNDMLPSGSLVRASVHNETVYTLPLHEDRIVAVRGPLGVSTVEVKDGKVRVKDSPCPRKLCVRQGWTDRGAITCLPNRVAVAVDGGAPVHDHGHYDAVTK